MKNKQKVSWWRVVGGFCLFIFLAELYVGLQLSILNNYFSIYSIWDFAINSVIFVGALLYISDLIPNDFHIVKNKTSKDKQLQSKSLSKPTTN